jgi:hypothetical protein
MFTIIFTVVAIALLFGAYKLYKQYRAQKAATGVGGVGAFARLAEADGKIIALKIAVDVKKAEALAVHAALDELNKLF